MKGHLHSVRQRFSSAASSYEEGAAIQTRAAERLLELMPARVDRVLEIGCGTGLLTRLLLQRYPEAELDVLDLSPRMVAEARRRTGPSPRLHWYFTDATSFFSPAPYPLIVSNCALHWIYPLEAGLRRLLSLLTAEGRLVFSIMLEGTLAELREARLLAAPDKPPALRLPTLAEVRSGVESAGGQVEVLREETLREEHPSAEEFLRRLHDMGLTGGGVSRADRPLNRGELARVRAEYARRCGTTPPAVHADYRAAFLVARRT